MNDTNMSSIDHTRLPFIPDKNGHVLAWKPGGFLQYLVFYSLHLFFYILVTDLNNWWVELCPNSQFDTDMKLLSSKHGLR